MPACVAVKAQVPAPVMVNVLPDTVQMLAALLVEKVNAVKPLVALADSAIGVEPNVTGVAGAKPTVWLAGVTTTLALREALA